MFDNEIPPVYDYVSNYDIPETDYRFSNRYTGDVPVCDTSPYVSPNSRQLIPNRDLCIPEYNNIVDEHTLRFDDIKEISMVKLHQLDNYDYTQFNNNTMYHDSLLKPVLRENNECYNTIENVKTNTLEELFGPKLDFSKDLRPEHEMLQQSFTAFNQQFMKPSFQTQNTFDFESPDTNILIKDILDVDICKSSISPPVDGYLNKYKQIEDDSSFEQNFYGMDLKNEKLQDINIQSNQPSIEESIIKVLEQYSEKTNNNDIMYDSNLHDFNAPYGMNVTSHQQTVQKCDSDIQNLGSEFIDDVQKEYFGAEEMRSLASDEVEKVSMFEGIDKDNLSNEHKHKDDKISSFIVFGLPKSAKSNNKSAHVKTDVKPPKKYVKTKYYGTKFVNQNVKSESMPCIKPSDKCLKSNEKPYISSFSKTIESSSEEYLPQIMNCEEFKKKIAALQQEVLEDKLNDTLDNESSNALFEKNPEASETTVMKSKEIHGNISQIGINNDSNDASTMKSSLEDKSNIQTMNPILSNNRKLLKESKYISNLPSDNSSIVDNQTNKEEINRKDSEHTQPGQYSESSQTINTTIRTNFEKADKQNSKTCKITNVLNDHDQDLSKDKTKSFNIVATDKTACKTYKKNNKMTVNNQIESQKEQETTAPTVLAKKETRWNNHRHARQSEAYKKYTLTIDNEDKLQDLEGQTTPDGNKSEAESRKAIETDSVPDSRRQRREIKKTLGSYKHKRRNEKRAKWKAYKPPQQFDGDDHKE